MTRRPLLLLLASSLAACGGAAPTPTPRDARSTAWIHGGAPSDPLPVAPPAASRMVRLDLRTEATLLGHGFSHHAGGTSSFVDGVLRTETDGYEEWGLRRDDRGATAPWWQDVDPERGWAVEARLRVLEEDPQCTSVGIWIHDGQHLLKLGVGPDRAGIVYPFRDLQPIGSTRDFRTYRVEMVGENLRVTVDGRTIVERDGASLGGGGTETLMFGDLGGCGRSVVEWDYFAYDTRPVFASPPCTECREREHVEVARLRRALAPVAAGVESVDTRATDAADTACLARDALDRTTHLLLPEVLDLSGRRDAAASLRASAPFFDTNSIRTALPLVRAALGDLAPRPRGMPKRVVQREEIDWRPPPPPQAPWLGDMSRAFELAAGERPQVALRHLRLALVALLREGYPVRATVERMMSEIASAARTRCAP